MSTSTRNSGKAITRDVTRQVRERAQDNTPTRIIGLRMSRTRNSVYSIASQKNIPLKPTNQRPYGTKKKWGVVFHRLGRRLSGLPVI
jgi:hypothetical protein